MAFAIWNRTIQDEQGNVQAGASVEVRDSNTNQLATLYSNRDGTTLKTNPFLTDVNGYAFFFATGGSYNVTASKGAYQMTFPYEAVGTAAEMDSLELAQMLESGVFPFQTVAQMNAFTPPSSPSAAVVYTGSGSGYYNWTGSAWSYSRALPDTFARLAVTGGTANAPVAAVGAGVNPSSPTVFFIDGVAPNTGSVTLTITGLGSGLVRNAAGNVLTAGEWQGRIFFTRESNGEYKIVNDPASALAAAQSAMLAGTSATAAAASAAAAESAAGGVQFPVSYGVAQTLTAPQQAQARANIGAVNGSLITPQEFNPLAGSSFSVNSGPAIQSAIDLASSTGRIVYLSGGEWGIASFINVKPHVRIILSSDAIVKRTSDATEMFRNWEQGALYSGRTAHGNWSIEGGVFDGDCFNLSTSSSMFVLFKAEGISFKGCTFKNIQGGHMFDMMGLKNVSFDECHFEDYGITTRDFSETIQIDVAGPSSAGYDIGVDPSSFDFTTCENIRVSNCTSLRVGVLVGSHGVTSWDIDKQNNFHTGITIENIINRSGKFTPIIGQNWRMVHIDNVICYGASLPASGFIGLEDCRDVLISNSTCLGTRTGFGLDLTRTSRFSWQGDIMVSNITIEGNNSSGVRLLGISDTILNGVKTKYGSEGFKVINTNRTTLLNCSVQDVSTGVSGVGFYVEGCNSTSIAGGTISGNYTIAFSMSQGVSNTIDGAFIDALSTGKRGVYLWGGGDMPIIKGCRLRGSGGTGIEVTASVPTAWVLNNDLRGMSGGTKMVLASGVTNTNNLS